MKKIDGNRMLYYATYDDGSSKYLKFNDLFLNDNISFLNWICDAGYSYLYIHSNGDIYPCETYFYDMSYIKAGNIYKLEDIKPKKTLCRCINCTSCDFGIHKKKVFK